MRFADIIGSDREIQYLRGTAASDRIPHALLFAGREGSAKLSLALAFAQYILCDNRTASDSCGKCSQCLKVSKLIHPDLHFSFPIVSSAKDSISDHFMSEWREIILDHTFFNAYDWLERIGGSRKQGNISKYECLNIIKQLGLKSFEAKHKVLILWMPEYLSREGNRLLKTIEEPPPGTVIMLVAENTHRILPTILSRCQILQVLPFPNEDVQAMLEREGIPAEEAHGIAEVCDGNMREAIALADQPDFIHHQEFLDWIKICYKGNMEAATDFADEMARKNRESIKQFLKYCLHFFNLVLRFKVVGAMERSMFEKEHKALEWLGMKLELKQIETIQELLNLNYEFVERNANERLVFTNLAINLRDILHKKEQSVTKPISQYM